MRFFSYGAEQDPFAKGRRLTFSFPKRKSYKKKLATLQVDRYANQLSRKSFFVPEGAVCFGKLHLHPRVENRNFVRRADFANLIGALVRIRAHLSRSLLRAVWAQTGEPRGSQVQISFKKSER